MTPDDIPVTMPKFRFGHPDTCSYCGEPADCIEHCIPYSFFRLAPRKTNQQANAEGITTWACNECNFFLGSSVFPDWVERVEHVDTHLQKKLAKNKTPERTPEEVDEDEGGLRDFIAAKLAELRRDQRRAAWVYSPKWAAHFSLLLEATQLDPRSPEFNPILRDYFARFVQVLRGDSTPTL